ncbi:MAG: hypothetical protein H0V17_08485 [Deltaproteobacteria bacterium]|nr:hypothetical protein [Deltaproteobacteria bacterium]
MRLAVVCVLAFTLAADIATAGPEADARAAIADAHAKLADARTKLVQAKLRANVADDRVKRARAKLAAGADLGADNPLEVEQFYADANLRDAHYELYEAGSRIKLAEARASFVEADAHERAGRIGSAARATQLATQLANDAADPDGSNRYRNPEWPPFNATQAEAVDLRRISFAREAVLFRRCSWLQLDVRVQAADLEDLAIMIGTWRLSRFEWRSGTPIDGGEHEIVVRIKGRIVWRKSFRVASEHGSASVLVDLLPKPVELAR